MILSIVGLVLLGVVLVIMLTAMLAPLESLGWWAGWFGDEEAPPVPGQRPRVVRGIPESPHPHFLVYLSGIGALDPSTIPQEEIEWLDALQRRIPQSEIVTDIFPYSVTNTGLSVQRFFARLWTALEKRRLRNPHDTLAQLINFRNLFQVAVSADHRYGPIYNLGVAREIIKALQMRGYRLGSGKPVTLVGYSGGAQVALGVTTFLKPALRAPIRIISLGGVMSDDVGILYTDKFYHLSGEYDHIQAWGGRLYAGRLKWFPNSRWNRARRAGRIEFLELPGMSHRGADNYFSWQTRNANGKPHALITIDMISALLVRDGVLSPSARNAAIHATAYLNEAPALEAAPVPA